MLKNFLICCLVILLSSTAQADGTDQILLNGKREVLQSFFQTSDLEGAMAFLGDLYRQVENEPNDSLKTWAYYQLASLYFDAAQIDSAKNTYWKGVKLARVREGSGGYGFIHGVLSMAEVFLYSGNYLFAERMLAEGVDAAKSKLGKQHPLYLRGLMHQGKLKMIQSDFTAAESYIQLSDSLYHQADLTHTLDYAELLEIEAELYIHKGSFTVGEHLLRKSDAIFLANKTFDYPFVRTHLLLAETFEGLNNLFVAGENAELSFNVLNQLVPKEHPEYGLALRRTASIYAEGGFLSLASERVSRSRRVLERSLGQVHPEVVKTMDLQARIWIQEGKLDTAEALLDHALAVFDRTMGTFHLDYALLLAEKGQCYYHRGAYDEALAVYHESLDIVKELFDAKHPFYERILTDVSEIHWAKGDEALAEVWFKKSTKNYFKHYRHYFAFLSEKEKTYHYEKIREYFNEFNSFALSRQKQRSKVLGAIYNNQLASKALLFHTTKEIKDLALGNPELVDAYKEWIHLKEKLAKLYKLDPDVIEHDKIPLEEIEEKAYQLEKYISLKVELGNKKNQDGSFLVDWKDLRKTLKPGEATVEMIRVHHYDPRKGGHLLDSITYLALIVTSETNRSPDFVALGNGVQLEGRNMKYYKNAIKYKMRDEVSYKSYWEPLAVYFAKNDISSIYFSPDGVYNQVSLNTLYNLSEERYLVDEILVNYLSNTKDLLYFHEADSVIDKNQHSLLIGFPDYNRYREDDTSLVVHDTVYKEGSRDIEYSARGSDAFRGGRINELPGTEIEIKTIARIFDEHNESYDIFLDWRAYEDVMKDSVYFAHSPHIVHIGTHGFFMPDNQTLDKFHKANHEHHEGEIDIELFNVGNENPLSRSGLLFSNAAHAFESTVLKREVAAALSNTTYEDGIFTAYEAANLNLSETELVVMSACETGLGVVKNGEGVYGLQRAFQTAGAQGMIMSLWKVSDEATVKFMTEFYKAWFGGQEKHEAFRTAQREIREEFPNPYFWGAFVMMGK